MTDVTMTARVTFYTKAAGTVLPGQTFTVNQARAAELKQRGFATETSDDGGAKAETAPLNKMEGEPLNKTDEGPKRSRRKPKADEPAA